jgi:hypothetical protein
VEEVAVQNSRVRVLRHENPRGEGAALRSGLAEVRHPLLVTATGDLRYQPADVSRFLAEIDRVHLVSGFRAWQRVPAGVGLVRGAYLFAVRVLFAMPPAEPLPGWLGWKGHAASWPARLLFGVRLRDVGCSFRLYRRDIFARIPIQSDGPFAHLEILAKANFLGCVMTETAVGYRPNAAPAAPPLRQLLAEGSRVVSDPDFGPAKLPEPAPG